MEIVLCKLAKSFDDGPGSAARTGSAAPAAGAEVWPRAQYGILDGLTRPLDCARAATTSRPRGPPPRAPRTDREALAARARGRARGRAAPGGLDLAEKGPPGERRPHGEGGGLMKASSAPWRAARPTAARGDPPRPAAGAAAAARARGGRGCASADSAGGDARALVLRRDGRRGRRGRGRRVLHRWWLFSLGVGSSDASTYLEWSDKVGERPGFLAEGDCVAQATSYGAMALFAWPRRRPRRRSCGRGGDRAAVARATHRTGFSRRVQDRCRAGAAEAACDARGGRRRMGEAG